MRQPTAGGGRHRPRRIAISPRKVAILLTAAAAVAGTVAVVPALAESVWSPAAAAGDVAAGQSLPNGDTVYPADPAARNFTKGTAGWTSDTDRRLLCVAAGVTCIHWRFSNSTVDGPGGVGSLHLDGNSLGLAPCIPEFAEARWNSPLFRYASTNARSWTINYDMKKTFLLLGEGHDSFNVQILDESGKVVATADAPQAELPWNKWNHHSVQFDGSKLVPGKNYRISFKVEVMQAEAAGGWGSLNISNVGMTTSPKPGNGPAVVCRAAKGAGNPAGVVANLGGLLKGKMPDFCPLTSSVGQTMSPLLDIGNQLTKSPAIAQLLYKGGGAIALASPVTGDFFGWMVPEETAPTVDPREAFVYLMNGTEGEMANYVLLFAFRTPHNLIEQGFGGPGGLGANLLSLVKGQIGDALNILTHPLLLVPDPRWTIDTWSAALKTLLAPLMSHAPRPDTAIGGTVWGDTNRNGIMDSGEPAVPSVSVTLTNEFGRTIGTQQTDLHGRYRFSNLDPTSDPNSYYLTFNSGKPAGFAFTTQDAPGSTHQNASSPDPNTGRTQRIALALQTQDLTWNAGVVLKASPAAPGGPGGSGHQGHRAVRIAFGTPMVNGHQADATPGPSVVSGAPVQVSVRVINTGNQPVTLHGVGTPLGAINCTPGRLQPGEHALCTATGNAMRGAHDVTIGFTVRGADGRQLTRSVCVHYSGRDA